ncbi:MAG TPA: hypothetical protein VLB44_15520 [Kofleriaceae bacterium]|nr:hypothetical protein [Kofleriaceae bacterium]
MTTERTCEPPRTSAFELRLYVVAMLAAVYVVAWRVIATPTPTPTNAAPVDGAPVPVVSTPGPAPAAQPVHRTVWIDDLPAALRPQVVLPPGWHVVSRTSTASTPAPQPRVQLVRVPASRPLRVRTRSS